MKKVLAEGHRGYCAKYPENTMISFEAALELGVDVIEFDVWLTADKVPVLLHDGNCRRTCGVDVHVRDLPLSEVKKLRATYEEKFGDTFKGQDIEIPTLEEVLILCKEKYPKAMLGVEIKEYTEENVDITIAMLKDYGFFDACFFYSWNGRIVKYLREKYNVCAMGYPDLVMQEFVENNYDYYSDIGLSLNFVRSEIFPIYAAKNMPMHMFCADTEEDVRMCIEKGAAVITANDPTALLKVLKEM